MKKTITLIILLIILAGCTGLKITSSKETITIPSIREGSQGIEIEYISEMPPAELLENQAFEIGFELQNKGAEDTQNGIYTIGLNEQYITMIDEKISRFNIKGKSIYSPLGNKQRVIMRAKTGTIGEQLTKQSTTIVASTCYEYATTASITTCMDTQPFQKNKVCTIAPIRKTGGQGGPVAVTYVEQKTIPHTDTSRIIPGYVIQIDNIGTGQVIDTKYVYDACLGRTIDRTNYDIVQINAMLSNEVLSCEPSQIKLREADNRVFCKLGQGISKTAGNYQAPLTVELTYGYMQTKPKTISILNAKPQY
jgi:hypothetical protein